MTFAARACGEPVGRASSSTGFDVSGALSAALALAGTTVDRAEAIILAGSHSSGEGVWASIAGRTVSLSDLDVYVVLADARAVHAARSRAETERDRLRGPLSSLGFVAPLELGFLSRAGLALMPAKPGVIELRRHGRVVEGDPGVLALVPAWSAHEVSAEERTLLLENRGFELLLAAPDAARDEMARLRARHATLKTALDLAGILALASGEWPDGAAARVQWARRAGLDGLRASSPSGHEEAPESLDSLWTTALDFRAAPLGLAEAATALEWRQAVRAWCAVWSAGLTTHAHDPWTAILTRAARAPWRRRIRQALQRRACVGPDLRSRVRHLAAGTPAHRVHGSAAVLLHAAALSNDAPVMPAGALRALAALGITREVEWERARSEVVRAWDTWFQSGQRTVEPV